MIKMILKCFPKDEMVEKLTVEHSKGSLAVSLQLWCGEGPLATLTKDFGNDAGNRSVVMPFCGWLDINNCPSAEEFVKEYGLGEPYTRFGEPVWMQSGYCTYPYYRFDNEKLFLLDPEGCKAYLENWIKSCNSAVRKVCG